MRKAYKYKLYPTAKQCISLDGQLGEACRLYNGALQERIDAYKTARISINYYDQANQLKEIRANDDLKLANFSACQDVLRRVDKSFKAFFNRVKRGEKAGFPRFKSASRFDGITFPSYGDGCKLLDNGKLKIQGVGNIKVKLHRPAVGKIKTVTVKREAGNWCVCFSVECEAQPLPSAAKNVGIDVGLTAFATLSDGSQIENPRYYRNAQRKLKIAQRRASRRKPGSNRRRKAVVLLQKAHAHIRCQRNNFHHLQSRRLINSYGLIAVEDLNIKGLAGGMLAKSVLDAGWSAFIDKLAYKAAEAGRELVKVDPRGTSQRCVCGAANPKLLSQRRHQCEACGLDVARDHASALEILRLGLSLRALRDSSESFAREAALLLRAE